MQIGVSTSCLFPMNTEDSLLFLARSGVREAEIFFNSECELSGTVFETIRSICAEYAIRVQAVHPYFSFVESHLFFGEYERRFHDGLEAYKRLCDAGAKLGCDKLVMHGAREPYVLSEDACIERFGTIAMETAALGVTLTQENVFRHRSASIEYLARMQRHLGKWFAMTLDVKQAVKSGVDPLELARRFAPQIRHLHLSDNDGKDYCLPVGRGTFDFSALFRTLHDAGFHGDGVLELYRDNFDDPSVLPESAEKLTEFSTF